MNINYKKNLSSLLFEEENKDKKVMLSDLSHAPFFLVPPEEFQPLKDQLKSGIYKKVENLLSRETSLRGNKTSTADDINNDSSLKDTAGLEKGDGLANLAYDKIFNIAKKFMDEYKSTIKTSNIEDELTRQQLAKFEVPPIALGEKFNINILNVKNEDTSAPSNNDLDVYTELGFAFFTLTMKAKEKSEEGSKNDKINVTRYLANNDNIVVFAMPVIKNFSEDQIEELKSIGLLTSVKEGETNESFIHNYSLEDLLFEGGAFARFRSMFGFGRKNNTENDVEKYVKLLKNKKILIDYEKDFYEENLKTIHYIIINIGGNKYNVYCPTAQTPNVRVNFAKNVDLNRVRNILRTDILPNLNKNRFLTDRSNLFFKLENDQIILSKHIGNREQVDDLVSEADLIARAIDFGQKNKLHSNKINNIKDVIEFYTSYVNVPDSFLDEDKMNALILNRFNSLEKEVSDRSDTTEVTKFEDGTHLNKCMQVLVLAKIATGLNIRLNDESQKAARSCPRFLENIDVKEIYKNDEVKSRLLEQFLSDLSESYKEVQNQEKSENEKIIKALAPSADDAASDDADADADAGAESDAGAGADAGAADEPAADSADADTDAGADGDGEPAADSAGAGADADAAEPDADAAEPDADAAEPDADAAEPDAAEPDADAKYRSDVGLILAPFVKRFKSITYDKFPFDKYKELIDEKGNLPDDALERIRLLSGRLIKDEEVVDLLLTFVEKLFINVYDKDLVRFKEITEGDFNEIQKLIEEEFVKEIEESKLFESYDVQGRKVINEAAILGGIAAAGLAKALGASIASCLPFLAMHLEIEHKITKKTAAAAKDAAIGAKDLGVKTAKGVAAGAVGAKNLSLKAARSLVSMSVELGRGTAKWIASTYKYLQKKYRAVTQALIKKEIQKALSKEGELIEQNKLLVGDLIAKYYSLYLKNEYDYDLEDPPAIEVKDVKFDTAADQLEKELNRSSEEVELFTDEFMKTASSWARGGGRQEPKESFMGKMFSKIKGEGVDIGSEESLSHLLFEKDIISEDVDQLSEEYLNEFEFLKRFKRNKDQDEPKDKDQDEPKDKDQDESEDKDQVINEDREVAHALYENRIQNIVEGIFRVIGKDVYEENLASNEERQEAISAQAAKTSQGASIAAVLGGYASIPTYLALSSGITFSTLGIAPAVALGTGAAIKLLGWGKNQLSKRGQIKSEDLKRLESQKDQFIIQLREIILRKVKDAKGIKESAIFKTNLAQFLFEADSGTFVKWESIERSLNSIGLFIYSEEFIDKFEGNQQKLEQIRLRFASQIANLIKDAFGTEVQGIDSATAAQANYYTFADNHINQDAPQGQSAMPQAFANALPNPPKSPSGPMNEFEQFMSLMNNSGGGLFAALIFMLIQQQFGKKAKKGQSMMDIMQMFFGSLADNQKDLPEEIAQDEQVQEAIVNKDDPAWLKSFYVKSTDSFPKITITYTENDKEKVKEAIKQLSGKLDTLQTQLPEEINGANCTINLKAKGIDNKIKSMVKDYINISSGEENKITLTKDFYQEEKSTTDISKFADCIIVGLLNKWFDLNASRHGVLKKTNNYEIDTSMTKSIVLDVVYRTLTGKETTAGLFQESRRVKGDLISEHRELLEMWRKL